MKKILIAITATMITVGVYAQADQKLPVNSDTAVYQKSTRKHPDGYMMKDGQMMCVKDQKITVLKNDTTLTNGTIVMRDGSYIRRGGTKMMFKEGYHMNLDGKIVLLSNSTAQVNEKKKMYLVNDTIKNKKN